MNPKNSSTDKREPKSWSVHHLKFVSNDKLGLFWRAVFFGETLQSDTLQERNFTYRFSLKSQLLMKKITDILIKVDAKLYIFQMIHTSLFVARRSNRTRSRKGTLRGGTIFSTCWSAWTSDFDVEDIFFSIARRSSRTRSRKGTLRGGSIFSTCWSVWTSDFDVQDIFFSIARRSSRTRSRKGTLRGGSIFSTCWWASTSSFVSKEFIFSLARRSSRTRSRKGTLRTDLGTSSWLYCSRTELMAWPNPCKFINSSLTLLS